MSTEYKKYLCENCGKGYDPAYSFINDPSDAELFVSVFGEDMDVCGECAEDMVNEIKE